MSSLKKIILPISIFVLILIAVTAILFVRQSSNTPSSQTSDGLTEAEVVEEENSGGLINTTNPLTIENLRKGDYPGSEIVIEQTLSKSSNYNRYVASYKSEGLKIFGLLTIPNGTKPEGGWPVIVFNHGYIPPTEYRTTEKYVAYQDAFARAGYITFKSDYRGHGNSDGVPSGAYSANDYTVDVLNATASLKKHPDADSERIGMWGHSMGGFITLRHMVANEDVKVGVIWAGVVGDYQDMLENWRRRNPNSPTTTPALQAARRWRDTLVAEHGTPQENPDFWNSISANYYLQDISGPIQLHHGTEDTSVPIAFSQTLEKEMITAGKEVELFIYQGDDHNLSQNLTIALNRSVQYFNSHLK